METKDIPQHQLKRCEILSLYLRELRVNSGLTQEMLSMQTGLHRNTIIRSENGCFLNLLNIFELADSLEISPKELFSMID